MASDEFDIIHRYFKCGALAFSIPELALGIGDDCALLRPSAEMELAMSMDILQEGVHFLPDADPYLLGKRSLLVNLSDLAAMGAKPLCFTLGLCLPCVDEQWLEAFSKGLAEVAQVHHCPLVGGDMSSASPRHGSKTLCIQVHGEVPVGLGLLRSGANIGDLIYVTGNLGDAAAGLRVLQETVAVSAVHRAALLAAFYEPESRVVIGQVLREFATSCIDLSDGLASDLYHVLQASGVGACIELDSLPLSSAFREVIAAQEQKRLAISGGDDYELCFTVPAEKESAMCEAVKALGVPVSRIGVIREQEDIEWRDKDVPITMVVSGFKHFASESLYAEVAF